MLRRYLFTAFAMLFVAGVYSAYAQITSRLLSQQGRAELVNRARPVQPEFNAGPRVSQELAEKYLSAPNWACDVPWASQARIKSHADGLHIYFNERRHQNGNTELRVSPVAMIWVPAQDADDDSLKEPLIIEAEAATFQFDRPVELTEIQTKFVHQIMLGGRVSIRGQDGLQVHGSNFTFSRPSQHLFSDEPVSFRMENHRAEARNLHLSLDIQDRLGDKKNSAAASTGNPEFLGVKDVIIRDYMEMVYVEDRQPPVTVTCDEQFQYVFRRKLATLLGNVYVAQNDELGFVNELSCRQLEIQLMDASAQTTAADAGQDQRPVLYVKPFALPGEEKLTVQSLRATGPDVTVRSGQNRLKIVGSDLHYNLPDQKLTMRDSESVKIAFRDANLYTPELVYEHDDQLKPILARCAGPGQIYYRGALQSNPRSMKPQQVVEVLWNDSLTMKPVAPSAVAKSGASKPQQSQAGDSGQTDSVLYEVILTGLANIKSPNHLAGLLADQLSLTIEHQDLETQATTLQPRTSVAADVKIPPGMKLRQAIASGNVAIASPQLEGVYDSIDLRFHEDIDGRLAQLIPASETNKQPGATIQQTSGSQPTSPSTNKPKPTAGQPNLNISARGLTLDVLHDAEFVKFHLEHVASQGEISATAQLPDQPEPYSLHGRSVDIVNGGVGQRTFNLLGTSEQDAWVQNGLVRIDGIDLYVDTSQNHARVHGRGALEFPVETDWEGTPLGRAELLKVSWLEKMTFTGRVAQFTGRVQARIGDSIITCEQLTVTLDQLVVMQQPEKSSADGNKAVKPKPKILEIICSDGVRFEMNHFEDGKLIAVRVINVANFRLNEVSGDVTAQGPGEMKFWQRRDGKPMLPLPQGAMKKQNPKSSPAESESGWDYHFVSFAGKMQGNIHQQFAILNDQVNLLHGPVDRPLVSFGRDDRPLQSVWMVCDLLEIDIVSSSNDSPVEQSATAKKPRATMELKASSNVEMEGDQFLARADSVTFDQVKNLFTIRANDNRYTTIWYYETPGSPPARYDSKSILMSPNNNVLKLNGTRGASGMQ